MTFTEVENRKLQKLEHFEVYKRIKDYYSDFIKKWNNMTESEKSDFIFGNGRTCRIDVVNNSIETINSLVKSPSITDSIELAKIVLYKSLEYSFYDTDIHEIRMGAYALYIINTFNNGKY